MVCPDYSLESPLERQSQGARLVGYLLICSLHSSGVMTGNWRKFQARAVPKSLPGQPSQSTKRVFLVVSDGHVSESSPVQARTQKVRHVFQRILVCHRARHSATNAIQQH